VILSRALVRLSWLVATLATVSSGTGLFWQRGGISLPVRTVRGTTVQLFGRGLYRYDTLEKAAILRGTDAVTLVVCIPLLILAVRSYTRGSLRGAVLLTSLLAYFLYNYASLAFGAAYNPLFLLYVALFSSSLFGVALAFSVIDRAALQSLISDRVPRRLISFFLFVAGGILALVWLSDIVTGLRSGTVPPTVQTYTTEVTYVIDLGVVSPAAVLAGVLVRQGSGLGYLLAAVMLTVNAIIGVVVVGQTVAMRLAGLTLTLAQLAAYVGSFVLLSSVATWLALRLFRGIG
jgi:hypothetical protein